MGDKESSKTSIRTFVFIDLETTGLYDKPLRITEICMVAAMREHIIGYGSDVSGLALPRVLSKLTICVCPRKMISQSATDVSGLTNDLLEYQNPFDEDLFTMLDCFLKRLPQPICMIAHNGIKFDFPILQREIQKLEKMLPDHILCADSLLGFRELLHKSKKMCKTEIEVVTSIINTNRETSIVSQESANITKQVGVGDSIHKDIHPLHNDASTIEVNQLDQEWKESGFFQTDYDEVLCAALEAVETSLSFKTVKPISFNTAVIKEDKVHSIHSVNEYDKDKDKHQKDFSEKAPQSILNDPHDDDKDYTNSLQQKLERTPESRKTSGSDIPVHKKPLSHDFKVRDAQTPPSINGKRGNPLELKRAKKKLNFSPEKDDGLLKSFKLGDIYRFLLKKEPVDCHRAENDSLILLECIMAMGERFLDWADNNAMQFNNIKKM